MGQEIELKLAVAPADANALWQVLAARHPGLKPASQALFTAYYDTPDARLKQHGVALRLRREGGRWIQAVKRAGIAAGGLHQRSEHEVEVAAQLPSFPAMADAGIGDLVADEKVREGLHVAFTTEFTRTSAILRPSPTLQIEVALDQGFIAAAGRRDPLSEIELELKSGDPAGLFDIALAIAGEMPVRLDNRSKAERGYALAANTRPSPVKAMQSRLQPDMGVGAAFTTLAFDTLAHLQANERGLLEGRNHEYLHQARVALRRLRSLFRAFAPVVAEAPFAPLLDALRGLANVLGEARNLDVFVAETLPRTGNSHHPGMGALRRGALAARRDANRTARQAVAAPAYNQLMLRLTLALVQLAQRADAADAMTLQAYARQALARERSKVGKRGRKLRERGYEDLHRLRIAIKRLRYAMEFFDSLAKDGGKDALAALAALQDLLGRLNDAATAWKLLDALAVEQASPDFQQAVGFVRGWTARDSEQCRDELPAAWKKFKKLGTWWE